MRARKSGRSGCAGWKGSLTGNGRRREARGFLATKDAARPGAATKGQAATERPVARIQRDSYSNRRPRTWREGQSTSTDSSTSTAASRLSTSTSTIGTPARHAKQFELSDAARRKGNNFVLPTCEFFARRAAIGVGIGIGKPVVGRLDRRDRPEPLFGCGPAAPCPSWFGNPRDLPPGPPAPSPPPAPRSTRHSPGSTPRASV